MQAPQVPVRDIIRLCIEDGSPDAWEQFVRRAQPIFARAAYRVASEFGPVHHQDVDDLMQDAFLKIAERGGERLRKVPSDSDAAAVAYLTEMAVNAARDHFRVAGALKRGAGVTGAIDDGVMERVSSFPRTPDVERKILLDQIDGCLRVPPRDRTVFWLYYRTGLTAKEIAALPSIAVGVKGVESLIFRLTKSVKDCLTGEGKGAGSPF